MCVTYLAKINPLSRPSILPLLTNIHHPHPAFTPVAVHSHLRDLGIQYVRLTWVDTSNIHRCRVVSVDRFAAFFREGAATRGVSLTKAAMALLLNYDAIAPGAGLDATGEVFLVPDPKTLKRLPYYPTHAICLVDMQEKEVVVKGEAEKEAAGEVKVVDYEFALCPRTVLKRVLR